MFDRRRRRQYALTFECLGGPVVITTLLRGEIFDCYLAAGFPDRVVPPGNPSAQASLETALFRLACLEKPEGYTTDSLPAGVVTQAARLALQYSGFLEETEEQESLLRSAVVYSKSGEARGDALVMHTFPRYGVDDLHDMTPEEWTRLVFLAVTVQSEIYGVKARDFLLAQAPDSPAGTADAPPAPALPTEFVHRVFGFSEEKRGGFHKTAAIAGGGSITPNGVKTWGST